MKTRKKLPKAIMATADETGAIPDETMPSAAASRVAAGEASGFPVAAHPSLAADITEIESGARAVLPVAPNALVKRLDVSPDRIQQRFLALRIVERYANYCAVGGAIPLPILNIAGVTAIVIRMVKMLSRHYRVPFERDRARAIVSGLIGGIVPTGIGTAAGSALFFVLPGSYLVGLAVSSITASTLTRKIGQMFVDHFERGATLADFPPATSR